MDAKLCACYLFKFKNREMAEKNLLFPFFLSKEVLVLFCFCFCFLNKIV